MTAPNLKKTMALRHLCPRHLVVQGLAPKRMLRTEKVTKNSTQNQQDHQREARDLSESR